MPEIQMHHDFWDAALVALKGLEKPRGAVEAIYPTSPFRGHEPNTDHASQEILD
jgi:hypothetical protein